MQIVRRTSGALQLAAGIAVGMAALVALVVLHRLAATLAEEDMPVAPTATTFLDYRFVLPALALPSVVVGCLLLARRRVSWAWRVAAATLLAVLAAVVLAVFLALIAPLYAYRPL